MRSTIKLSLLATVSMIAMQAAFSGAAIAGSSPVLPEDGSNAVGDNFGPPTEMPRTTIEDNAVDTLESIESGSSVPTADGDSVPVPPEVVSIIRDSLQSETPGGLNDGLLQLEQQIANELGSREIELSRVSSTDGIRPAVQSANDVINGLSDQQIAAAAESPTFLSLLEILRNANATLNGDPGILFEDGNEEFGLFSLSPVAPEPEPVIPIEPIEPEPPITQPQPPVEPIRGLW
ncbi:MAG: hypothetical protein AAFV85_26505 [Cyanobacteria bacterium J06634_6]